MGQKTDRLVRASTRSWFRVYVAMRSEECWVPDREDQALLRRAELRLRSEGKL